MEDEMELNPSHRVAIDAGYDCILPELNGEEWTEIEQKMQLALIQLGKQLEKDYGIKIIDTDMPALNIFDWEG